MNVVIYYCSTCGFQKPAARIAGKLAEEFGLTVQLVKGFWGTFRIECDGVEIFNRWKTRGILGRIGCGRTPTADEIIDLIRERTGNPATATVEEGS